MALPAKNSPEGTQVYCHSPLHLAIFNGDHLTLRRILDGLPKPPPPGSIRTEAESVAAEKSALVASATIDRRDVRGKESPLCLAVRLKDGVAVDLLMAAGADVSLQNAAGWTPLQEAVCARDEALTATILRRYQVLTWGKYMRRLPALSAIMKRMRNFYMELTWNFESSVIPFITRIAPSDTYRIWKRGPFLRADMSLAGFDGLRIKRKNQSLLFFGESINDQKVKPGTIVMLNHEKKESFDALEGAGGEPSEAEVAQDVRSFFQTNVYRAGIDVSGASVLPQNSWRGYGKTEIVNGYRTKVYEMHNVHLKFKSRQVPGAMTDEELFGGGEKDEKGKKGRKPMGRGGGGGGGGGGGEGSRQEGDGNGVEFGSEATTSRFGKGNAEMDEEEEEEEERGPMELEDVLTEEERKQLDEALEGAREAEEEEVRESWENSVNGRMRDLSVGGREEEGSSLLGDREGEGDRKEWGNNGRAPEGEFRRSNSMGPTCDEGKIEKGGKREGWFGGRQREVADKRDLKREKEEYRAKGRKYRVSWGGTERSEDIGEGIKMEGKEGGGGVIEEEEGKVKEDEKQQNGWVEEGEEKGGGGKSKGKKKSTDGFEKKEENEFKKGLKPMLWLTEDFPLDMKEIMPLLDLLANKVKAVRRVKELLMTKLPPGTVPVKVAIPIIPTIRVSVTFSCFEEYRAPVENNEGEGEEEDDNFHTPTGSPERDTDTGKRSWLAWVRGERSTGFGKVVEEGGEEETPNRWAVNPFEIPSDYRWIDMQERKRRDREKRKRAKAKARSKAVNTEKKGSGSSENPSKNEEKGELI